MAITKNPNDKYAFLFSGPATERALKDLENVSETLIRFYNYPESHVWVVLGESPPPMTDFFGATVRPVITNTIGLSNEMANFATMANSTNKTVVLYFTGGGLEGETGTDNSKLVITGGATPAFVDGAWLTPRLNTLNLANVNIIMEQPYAGGFHTALTTSTLTEWSFVFSCGAHEQSYGDYDPVVLGSYFTYSLCQGLQLQPLPMLTEFPGKFADELGAGDEDENLMVSLQEAMVYAKQMHDHVYLLASFSIPGYKGPLAGGTQYLGKPDLVIRDGTPWFESPDIFLTHPNYLWVDELPDCEDLYIPDDPTAISPFNNTINVRVRNFGSHPVRKYSAGLELFKTGGGGSSSATATICDHLAADGLLRAIDLADISVVSKDDFDVCQWNVKFEATATHRCVKAEVRLYCPDVDFAWDPADLAFEGQRNIDVMETIPLEPELEPFFGLMGFKEHIYGVKNTFEENKKFLIVFPDNYLKYDKKLLQLQWYHLLPGAQSERIALETIQEPVPHLAITLKPGEERDILLHAGMEPWFDIEEGVKLPFEILVETREANTRPPATIAEKLPGFAAFGGFTVRIKKGSGVLKGKVVDKYGRPAAKARLFLRTINGLQGAVLTTDEYGRYETPAINADIYRLWAEVKDLRTPEQTVLLLPGKTVETTLELAEIAPVKEKRVKVILDRIRILNDKDPFIGGKGELVFNAMVVPDNDNARKKVMRLPAEGFFHVSEKAGKNDIKLGVTLFDGVVKNGHLAISIAGEELDFLTPDDELSRYYRMFAGNPETWRGEYHPSDEYLDKEDVGEWALWYRIDVEEATLVKREELEATMA